MKPGDTPTTPIASSPIDRNVSGNLHSRPASAAPPKRIQPLATGGGDDRRINMNMNDYGTASNDNLLQKEDKLHESSVSTDTWLGLEHLTRPDKRRMLFKAAGGEFLSTALFLFIVMAAGLNMIRSNNGKMPEIAAIVGPVCTAFAAVAMVYSFADISGAHFNPAITFGTVVGGKNSLIKGTVYILSQMLGGVVATLLLMVCFPKRDGLTIAQELVITPPDGEGNWFYACAMETVLSFILIFVVYSAAFDTNPPLNDPTKETRGFAAMSIGLTIGFLCFLGGSVSGGVFNPARVFGPGILAGNHKNHWESMWLYWMADFVGASLAAVTHQAFFVINKRQRRPSFMLRDIADALESYSSGKSNRIPL